jgi:hypothetical protein
VLLADEGENNREIARKLKISRKMASQWRERWIAGQKSEIEITERIKDAIARACHQLGGLTLVANNAQSIK